MALAITAVPDIKYVWGESGRAQAFQLQPGTSDYVTGGYPITSSQVELGLLVGATMLLTNAAGALYDAEFVAVAPLKNPQTSIKLLVSQAGVQVANGANLSTLEWTSLFIGW